MVDDNPLLARFTHVPAKICSPPSPVASPFIHPEGRMGLLPTPMKPPILIVGAGPSGSILALVLLHNGIPVRLIETTATHPIASWHSASLLPRALELFTALGFVDEILEHAIRIPNVLFYNKPSNPTQAPIEYEMFPYADPTPASPYLSSVFLSQPRLEKIFHAALARKGCIVEKGIELVSFKQLPDHVSVKLGRRQGERLVCREENYEWMIGADGASALVCRLLGLEFFGDTKGTVQQLVGDIHVEGVPPKTWQMWGSPPENHMSLRSTEDTGIFTFNANGQNIDHAKLCENEELLKQFLHEYSGRNPNIKFGEILWSAVYTTHPTVVDKFVSGRVIITGVCGSPISSQALAGAIQDAYNVAWKLALVHRKISSYSLLNSYSEERLPVVAEMIDKGFKVVEVVRKQGRDALKKRGYDQLGVNCRWSSIVFDERKKDTRAAEEDEYFHDYDFDHAGDEDEEVLDAYGLELDGTLTAGDRAPDAPGLIDLRDVRKTNPTARTWRLFHIFGPSYHTVLIFLEATRRWPCVLKSLSAYPEGTVCTVLVARRGNPIPSADAVCAEFVLEDRHGHAHDAYVLDDKYGVVVVRPDGVVGAIAKGIEGVNWYFQGIFAQRRSKR